MPPTPHASHAAAHLGPRSHRGVLVVLVLALVTDVAVELAEAPAERVAEIQRWRRDLEALADDRRLGVVDWLRSASLDVRSIAGARRTETFVHSGPTATGEATQPLIVELLDRFVRPRGESISGAWVLDLHGSILASTSDASAPDPACIEAAEQATVVGQPGAIHRHGDVTVIPIAATVLSPQGAVSASGSALFAFAAQPLFARIARRPSQPETLETYLVHSNHGRLEFLSPLKFGSPVARAFDDPRLGARAAAEGREIFSEGLDYRLSPDNPVLTVTRAIPGTGWGLVVEIDVSEALAPLRERVQTRRLISILIWLGIAGAAYGVARAQRLALAMESARVADRYIALVDNANDALVVLDDAGRIVEVNRRACELYERSRDELLGGLHARAFWPSEEHALMDTRFDPLLKEGAGVFEAVHVRAGGTQFPVEVSARVVAGPTAERRVVMVIRDITARRADADRILRLNRLLRTLTSVNELLIRGPDEPRLFEEVCRISVEHAGFLLACISLADRATGRVEIAARAGTAQDYLDDIEMRWDEGPLAQGPTGTAIREERTVVRRALQTDERFAPWRAAATRRGFSSSAATPIRRAGKVIGALSLYSGEDDAFDPEIVALIEDMGADISFALTVIDNDTKIRRAEEQARRVLLAIEQVNDSVLITDRTGTLVYANPAACRILGYELHEIIGQHPSRWKQGDASVATDQEMWRILNAGGSWRGTLANRTKAGETVQLSTAVSPIRGAAGQIEGFVGVSRDITRERALQLAKDAAEHASRVKSSFLAHISHEIRTPMNAILGYAQLLLREAALDAKQKQKVEVIHSSGSHLLKLLNDVLEMSKIEAGHVSLSTAPFDLRAILSDVENMFSVLTRPKGVALTLDCDAALPSAFEGDGGKVKQIAINLVSNAVKFTDSGHVAIRAASTSMSDDRHSVRIEVEDTGIGIDSEGLERLFQAFEQLAAGARIGGTGLGLAISRQFARLMGGDISVRSTPNRGSVFTLTFDARTAAAAEPESRVVPLPLSIAANQQSPKVLIVDDVATNRALCEELLLQIGFITRTAASGEEALSVHEAWQPDLILMDLRMPGMDGLETMRRLRAAGSKTRIVALTASGMSDAEPVAIAAGADVFLRKPFADAELLQRIGSLLGLHYAYANTQAQPPPDPLRPLSQLLKMLPDDLVRELKDAATRARTGRVAELATRASEHSPEAAAAIREAIESFRYDVILSAIESRCA